MGFSGGAPAAGESDAGGNSVLGPRPKGKASMCPLAAVRLAAQQSTAELPNGPGAVGLPDIACDPSDWDREWLVKLAGTGCRGEGSKLLLCCGSGSGSLAETARRRTSALPAAMGASGAMADSRRTRSRIGVEAPLTWPGSNRCFSAFTGWVSWLLVFWCSFPPFSLLFFFSFRFERGLAVV